jgi:uncharacterized membrane protein
MPSERAQALTRGPRHRRRGEARLPAAIVIGVAILLYLALPQQLLVGPRYIVPAVELILLILLIAINPRRVTRQTKLSRALSLSLVAIIALTNLVALGLLIQDLVSAKANNGQELLLGALQVWTTNVIAFGLAFWELDRGGPVRRTQSPRSEFPLADFRFSQDEDEDTVEEVADGSSVKADWVPTLVDYLYVSVTNSTAFSPTDTMPLSARAKALMGVQGVAALLTSLLIIARAVSVLR